LKIYFNLTEIVKEEREKRKMKMICRRIFLMMRINYPKSLPSKNNKYKTRDLKIQKEKKLKKKRKQLRNTLLKKVLKLKW
jgi:hypothetical protein